MERGGFQCALDVRTAFRVIRQVQRFAVQSGCGKHRILDQDLVAATATEGESFFVKIDPVGKKVNVHGNGCRLFVGVEDGTNDTRHPAAECEQENDDNRTKSFVQDSEWQEEDAEQNTKPSGHESNSFLVNNED